MADTALSSGVPDGDDGYWAETQVVEFLSKF